MKTRFMEDKKSDYKTIDEHHQKLFNHLKYIKQQISSGTDMGPLRRTIDFLGKYAKEHFDCEEKAMSKQAYPDIEKHKEAHGYFKKYFEEFKIRSQIAYSSDSFSNKELKNLMTETYKFLENWLIDHILTEDQKFMEFSRLNK